ncbi:MAG: Phage integrase SAM-like domain [Chlorobi bacterium]|nr:Phage integrase SAM-like domain [Chlorobiota bacterium]
MHLRKMDFVKHLRRPAESKPYKSWRAAYQHLEKFTNGRLSFEQITTATLESLKVYLRKDLHNNSAWLYYGKIRAALNQAVREGISRQTIARSHF